MSYWDEHEKIRGTYDFKTLDQQIKLVRRAGGKISLCLGARQPRWPENHWPKWALSLQKKDKDQALLDFLKATIERYKNEPTIENYQLENEALLKSFGEHIEIDRKRLRKEMKLVRNLDPNKKVNMSTSSSWGIPIFGPIPDEVGFSFYLVLYNDKKKQYTGSLHKAWLDKLRAGLIKIIWRKESFIHELQLEPWGPEAIWKMSKTEQDKSMSINQIKTNIKQASKTKLYPIYLWGGEWWYWRMKSLNDPSIWDGVNSTLIKFSQN